MFEFISFPLVRHSEFDPDPFNVSRTFFPVFLLEEAELFSFLFFRLTSNRHELKTDKSFISQMIFASMGNEENFSAEF